MRKSVIAVNPASLFLSVQGKNTSYKRHKDFLMFFSPCNIVELQIDFKSVCSPLVLLSQGKGHICLLFYAATELSDIRSDGSFSSRGTWAVPPADPFYPGLGAGAGSPCREWGWQPEGNSASGMGDWGCSGALGKSVLATA